MVAPNRPSYAVPRRTEAAPNANPAVTGLLLALAGVVIPGFIAYGMGTANEFQVLAIVIGAIGIVSLLARPFLGLIVFVALLYTRPEESIRPLAGMHFTLIISLMTLLGLVMQMMLNRERPVRAPTIGMIIGFGAVAIASCVFNKIGMMATLDFARLVVLVILILNLIRTPERYRGFVTALIIFTCYLAVYSALLFLSGQGVNDQGLMRSRGTGIFSDPNDLAATMVAGLALALTRCVLSDGKGRLGYGLICLTILWAILLSHSRGGMLALITVVFCFFLMFSRRKVLAIVLALACIGLVLVAAPDRMKNMDNKEGSANSRFHYWEVGIHETVHHPILGIGFTKFPDVNGGFVAHNSFVHCFTEEGLIGYFFWMGCIYYAYRRRIKDSDEPAPSAADTADLTGARLALAGYMSACFWISRCYTPIMYIFFSLPIAQQIAYSGNLTLTLYTRKDRLKNWARIFGICLGSIVMIWLIVQRLK